MGQFTQQDPIGIAGGLNLYGYANGDPVNFSDPFGLCPEDLRDEEGFCPGGWSVEQWETLQGSLDNVTDSDLRENLDNMLEAGEVQRGIGLLARILGGADFAVANRLTGNIELADEVLGYEPGDIAFTLAHESRHLTQPFLMRGNSAERDADRFGCAVTTGRVVFAQGGYPSLGGCR